MSILLFVFVGSAQDTLPKLPAIFYKNEQSIGLNLHAHGMAVNYRMARWQNVRTKSIWEIGSTYIKHPKEVKSSNPYYGSSEKFYFGKKNSSLTLYGGIGQQKEWAQKAGEGSLGVRFLYQAGVAMAIVKPIYYQVLYVYDSVSVAIRDEKFSSAIHTKNSIYGKAAFSKGLDELRLIPAAYLRVGVSFEFSAAEKYYHALELGIAPFLYAQKLPIMDSAENYQLFVNLFVGYRFGLITDNLQMNRRRLRRLSRKLE